jgi:hypothetical protein
VRIDALGLASRRKVERPAKRSIGQDQAAREAAGVGA